MPSDNPLWEVLETHLTTNGLYSVQDPTYGRYLLPPHPPHQKLFENPAIHHRYRRVFLRPYKDFPTLQEAYDTTEIIHAEDVQLTKEEIAEGVKRGGRWVTYSVWEMDEPLGGWEAGGRGVGTDLVMVHGLSDYGLRYAPHLQHFMKSGLRIIIPDLPSYGRSTGINSYLPSLLLLPSALQAVLMDVVSNDLAHGREQRKVFLSGASMGGWTCLYYILKYPPTASPEEIASEAPRPDAVPPIEGSGKGYADAERPRSAEKVRPQVAGAFVLCPALEVSKASRPWPITELIGRGLRWMAGSLPLAKALRGKVSDDPRVEEDFYADPICYHGWLRIGTGFSLLEGMAELQERAEEVNLPLKIVQGKNDRVVDYRGAERFFNRLPNEDKELEIYDGYEHVMLRIGHDEEDDKARQRVLADFRSWILKRC